MKFSFRTINCVFCSCNPEIMFAVKLRNESALTGCGRSRKVVESGDPCLVECPPPEFDGVCLGDLFGVAWLEDSDAQDRTSGRVQGQHYRVAYRTAAKLASSDVGSQVAEYGDIAVSFDSLATYMGVANRTHASADAMIMKSSNYDNARIPSRSVSQRDVHLLHLRSKFNNAPEGSAERIIEAYKELKEAISQREHVDKCVRQIGELSFGSEKGQEVFTSVRPAGQPLVNDWECLKSFVETFESHCGTLTPYGRKNVGGFANLCNAGIEMNAAAKQACASSGITDVVIYSL